MGCTCLSSGDEVRGEFVPTRERVPRMQLQYQCPESLWLFFLLPEEQILSTGAAGHCELQDMFQQFYVDHSLDIKCLTSGQEEAQ